MFPMMTNIKLSKWTLEFITKKEQYKINECGQQPVTKKLVRGLLLHRNPISNLIIEIKKTKCETSSQRDLIKQKLKS